jgi:hypothetical protein
VLCYIKGMAKVGGLVGRRGGEVLMVELVVEWIKCSKHREGDLHMLIYYYQCLRGVLQFYVA